MSRDYYYPYYFYYYYYHYYYWANSQSNYTRKFSKLSHNQQPKIPRNFDNILTVPNKTVFWNCPISAVIPLYFNLLLNCLCILPKEPKTNGIIFTLTFHIFCNSLPRCCYFFIFNFSFSSILASSVIAKSMILKVLLINYNQIQPPSFYNMTSLNTKCHKIL